MASGSSSAADSPTLKISEKEFKYRKVVPDPIEGGADEGMCIGRNNQKVAWGYCKGQGLRQYMEDRIRVLPAFMSMRCPTFGGCTAPHSKFALEESPIHYFAVFDGHGGKEVSSLCKKTLHNAVKKGWESGSRNGEWRARWESGLCRAYDDVDKVWGQPKVGSTAVVVLISPCQIVAANCGDSRAVLCRASQTIPLTHDHKPDREDEKERIVKSGGRVAADRHGIMRINGALSLSRAIGDHWLKPLVSSVPEFSFTTRSVEDECLIIASDGLWDVMSTEVVGDICREMLRSTRQLLSVHESPSKIVAEYLYDKACSKSSKDNCSIIVVDLKPT